ncbi:RNA polymerase sigma-70 factor (sigma-E family) [Kibdelosporangium banguiense]|uniref:RNA polymerase sigma-70 factor (Sigma-E family) n=1 Tax=Kibdelosporangium banguiense TaxID=1365924 RepID=A0ABS4T797_9PSEU|nr:SigE family RNA polymerase sigma factor [Kibdelosporangium banguiense]MBP2320290.1 RNA polymerase sigma-70 factor (sigma-E family) [Kibdelosporangium banguiense]
MRDVAELYRQEWHGLLRLAVLLTGDRGQAEDLVQDAFVGLQRRFHRLTDPVGAIGYLRVSVVNGARSAQRRRIVAWRHQRAAEPDGQPPLDAELLLAEEHREVLTAVRRLPRRQQEVLILRYWANLSEAEIAATLGVSRGTVKTCASRALATLGDRLGVRHA